MNIIEKSKKLLEFDKICEKLSGFTKLKQSKALCLEGSIYSDISKIKTLLIFTREAKKMLDCAIDIPVDFICETQKLKESLKTSYLQEEEIIDVAKSLKCARLVKNCIRENTDIDSALATLASDLYANKDLEDRLFSTFDDNLCVKPDATNELKGLFSSLRDSEKNLKTKVNELLNSSTFSKHLQEQIYTTRDDRIVFQVKASDKSKVGGIVHDISGSNQTLYIEPAQIVPLNNKIREVKSKISAEIIRILVELTAQIKGNIEDLATNETILAELDLHFAKARYAIKLQAVEPEIVSDKILKIDSMRHPLISECVPNDFRIGNDYKSIVITGSNTGGKTVTIKTIGLFILMARSGMFLPCYEAKIYPFDKVLADIGDEQNILQSLSTFSSHMTNIINILKEGDNNTFVILDEICAGTDPVEGAVLAQVILEKMASKGITSTVTTHYGELKALEFSNNYFKNASVEFDTISLKPTYKLIIGIPGLSNAISISANLGLDNDIVEKAKNILVSQKDPSILVVEKLQETHQNLSVNLKETEVLKEDAASLKKEYETKLDAVKKEKKKTISIIKDRFDRRLEAVKSEMKEILDEVRRTKSEKIARRAYSRLAKIESGFRGELEEINDKETYKEPDWTNLKSGDEVMLKELNQAVKLIELPDKNKNVTIQMGSIRTKVKMEKLAALDDRIVNKPITKKAQKEEFRLRKYNISNTLDLRGFRVEDALDDLEVYLDKASLANLTPVYIIHGHGTGALKSAVRDYLKTSPYVAKFRVGEPSEGGDGVSIIDIN